MRTFLPLVMLTLALHCDATVQDTDSLDLGNRMIEVYGFKLSGYLTQKIEQMREESRLRVANSGNWDGFYADLALKGKELHLVSLTIDWPADERAQRKRPVPLGSSGENEIPCVWFSGDLRGFLGGGTKVLWWRTSYKYARYTFDRGRLVKITKETRKFRYRAHLDGEPEKGSLHLLPQCLM